MALCSLSTGRIATPRRARRVHHEPAGHHQHFLVGERDRLAGVDRREHGFERGRARRGAQHEVDVGMGGDGDQAFAADARDSAAASRRAAARSSSIASPVAIATARGRIRRGSARPSPPTFVAGGQRRRPHAVGDARRPRRARWCRSIRSSRGWRSRFIREPRRKSRRAARQTAARRCDRARRRGPG